MTGGEQLQEKIDMLSSGFIVRSDGKSVRMTVYDAEGNVSWWHEYTYSKEGWPDQVRSYSADNTLVDEIAYQYDERGRALSRYSYDDKGRLGKIEYTLGEGNEILKTVHYVPGQDVVEMIGTSEYDAQGRRIKENMEFADGMSEYMTYEYDADGNMIKMANYNEIGELIFYSLFMYENGRPSVQEIYDNTDTLILRSESVYDENGELIEERTYNSNGELNSENIFSE